MVYLRVATVSKDGSWKLWNIDGMFVLLCIIMCFCLVKFDYQSHLVLLLCSCLSQKGRAKVVVIT